MTTHEDRPDPDQLLKSLKTEEVQKNRGRLKIFFGMCAGVGKTYDMLKAAQLQRSGGTDLVIGLIETHGRRETELLLEDLPLIPRKRVDYKGTIVEEMDLDALLARKPALTLVDELAHTNAPGSRHAKRYQDVLELLDHGIDVYTTLNVQHLESRADTVAQITGAIVRETVPDSIFEAASEVELVDISPDELLKRLEEGKVYAPERSRLAVQHFFRKGNLTALREMALRLTAERVDHQLRELMAARRIPGTWKSGQRLVVAIGPSPGSVSLIRWARRTAYTMNATWVALHVESSATLTGSARDQLAKNLALARELGAELVTTADEDLVEGILRVAREQHASQILVGKPGRGQLFRRSLLDRLIERSGELDIYVVGGSPEGTPAKVSSLAAPTSGLRQYVGPVLIVALVSLLCLPLRPLVGYQTISLILLFVVAILPLRFGIGPVIAAAAVSALAWDFLFIPPQFTFAIGHAHDILMLGAYFVIAAVTGVLTARIRARERAVRVREERAMALLALTKDLSAARSLDEVVTAGVRNIGVFFKARIAVFLSDSDGDLIQTPHASGTFDADAKEIAVAAWTYWNDRKAGRFTTTLPSVQATYYPLSGPRYPLGVVGVTLTSNEPLSTDQEALLENFLRQIASSIEREQLHEFARKTLVVAESERLYKTLFDSLSHEFRTPVSTLLGGAEQLLQEPAVRNGPLTEVLTDMRDAATRLHHLVRNLMDMTRLESGLLKVKRDWCDVADIIGTAVRKAEELPHHLQVQIAVTEPMPLLKADQGLLEQVLGNILQNAATHAIGATRIDITARTEENDCVIAIADNGKGIPAEAIDKVFGKFYRAPGAATGGTGLGLSIARGFVLAHGGSISCDNRPGGGARFTIRLPLGPHPAPTVLP
jgi:two-component system, OmpR family, sensor histidine kinase KdpD